MRQRIVTTGTRDKDKKSRLIISCLEGYPEGLPPSMIAFKTGLNVNTVKSLLPRTKGIKKKLRGLYIVVKGGDGAPLSVDLLDWNFHNLILTAPVVEHLDASRDFDFGLVKASLDVSAAGKATFRVSSDHPLNVSSIAFVAGFFAEVASLKFDEISVSTVEFNHDYRNLRLDGVKSITVDNLITQFKAYQKRHGLRLEHKMKVPLAMENVVDILSNQPNTVELNVKLSQQRELIEKLIVATDRQTELLYATIDRLRGERT